MGHFGPNLGAKIVFRCKLAIVIWYSAIGNCILIKSIQEKKEGRAIVIPNGYPPCFNCYLTDLRPSLGRFFTSQLHVQYCNLSVAQFLMQRSPGTSFWMAQGWGMLHGKLSIVLQHFLQQTITTNHCVTHSYFKYSGLSEVIRFP